IYGEMTIALRPRSPSVEDARVLIDAFVASLGFSGLGQGWEEINRDQAESILRLILHKDLAYRMPITPLEKATSLAGRFLALFSRSARWFTNGTYHLAPVRTPNGGSAGPSWNPISQATFDTGVVCIDESRIGIMWVQDED